MPMSPPAAPVEPIHRTDLLPGTCPHCGAPIRAGEVEMDGQSIGFMRILQFEPADEEAIILNQCETKTKDAIGVLLIRIVTGLGSV